MTDMKYYDLERFVEAQDRFDDYETAKNEMYEGEKRTHWIWYIFPQIKGLGLSGMSKKYAIDSLFEAFAYMEHPVLGTRLTEISQVLYERNYGMDIENVMGGRIDAMKLKSSMTLFEHVHPDCVFSHILDHFFGGQRDVKTLKLIESEKEELLGRDAFSKAGIERMPTRAFLEGIDGDLEATRYLATVLDLMKRGHSLRGLCKHHLVDHRDILNPIRTNDVEFHICWFAVYFFTEAGVGAIELSSSTAETIQEYLNRFQRRNFDYCLEAADLFDEFISFIETFPQIQNCITQFIKTHTLIKNN